MREMLKLSLMMNSKFNDSASLQYGAILNLLNHVFIKVLLNEYSKFVNWIKD